LYQPIEINIFNGLAPQPECQKCAKSSSDELIQWMIDAYHADRKPPSEVEGMSPHPSTPEAVQSTPPASPAPEIEQQAVLTVPAGTREDDHGKA
jgi:hypothetical protein